MTAPEVIEQIENAGGLLVLRGVRISFRVPEEAAPLLDLLRQHREEVFQLLQRRAQSEGCCRHGADAHQWLRTDRSRVCELCHPNPNELLVQDGNQSGLPPIPEGLRLVAWAPKFPPVAIETFAIVNDVPQFIRATLEQMRAALAGENWLAGNFTTRELIERLEQVGVSVEVHENF